MKLKQRVGDFRVRELLQDDYLRDEEGEFRIYRVTKRKLTTPEACRALADELGVDSATVSIGGLKDRQGITIQHVSVPRGRKVRIQSQELGVEPVGFADEAMSSAAVRGNGFEVSVRALLGADAHRLRKNLPLVRSHGLVNYFDDQRFGNLTHGQGWIAKHLMLGENETALHDFFTARSERDDPERGRFKQSLADNWGDWRACREIAGRRGEHHSVFEHLMKNPTDFGGAFYYVSSRLRLIHLYAFQSHLWNRAVAQLVREKVPVAKRSLMECVEGQLVAHSSHFPEGQRPDATFRLPGEGLEDVEDEDQRRLLADVLAEERLVPDQFRISDVSGFALKGEERALFVFPEHLRVRPAESDGLNRGLQMIRVRFELPRGSYATLVIKRLLAVAVGGEDDRAKRAVRGSSHGTRVTQRRPYVSTSRYIDERDREDRFQDERASGDRRERAPGGRPGGFAAGGRDRDPRQRGSGDRAGSGGQRSGGGGWRGRDDGRGGGAQRGGERSSGDAWRGRDEGRGGGAQRGGERSSGDAWRGRDEGRGGGAQRGGERSGGGAWRGRDEGRGGGAQRGGERSGGGAWRGRDDARGGGTQRGGERSGGGAWRGRDDARGGGAQRGGERSGGGAWRGRDDARGGGAQRGGERSGGGAWRGRDDGRGGGAQRGGERSGGGAWRGRDDGRGSRGGQGAGGSWRGRDAGRGQGGGERPGGSRTGGGAWRGRDDGRGSSGGQRGAGGGGWGGSGERRGSQGGGGWGGRDDAGSGGNPGRPDSRGDARDRTDRGASRRSEDTSKKTRPESSGGDDE